MKTLLTFLLLSLLAFPSSAQKISDYRETLVLSNNYLFVIAVPGVTNYKTTFGTLASNIAGAVTITGSATNAVNNGSNLALTNATTFGVFYRVFNQTNIQFFSLKQGTNIVMYRDGSNIVINATGVSGGSTVASPLSSVQFNNGGVMAGSSGLIYTNERLLLSSNLTIGGSLTNLNSNAVVVLLAKSIQRKLTNNGMGFGAVDFQYLQSAAANQERTASGNWSFIGGGEGNHITTNGQLSFIGGGIDNIMESQASFIGAGNDLQIINPLNVAQRFYNGIVSGSGNIIDQGQYAFIGSGFNNSIGDGFGSYTNLYGVIGGGANNQVHGNLGAILGGDTSVAEASGAQIVGSQIINNVVNGVMIGYGPSNVLTVAPSGTTNSGLFVLRPSYSGTSYFTVSDTNGSPRLQVGVYPSFPQFGTLWLGGVTPNATNYSLTSDGVTTTVNGAGSIALSTGVGGSKWIVNSTGHFLAATDNFYDIGAPGATRPRSVYIGTMPGSGDHVAVSADGLLMRTNITSGIGSTQMVTAAIGTLTVSNTFSVPIFNTITGNFAFLNLTNFLGSNQVRLGMAQLTNVSFVSLAEGNSLFWNATMGKFTNAPGGSGAGTPAGPTNAIQFNNNGVFGGSGGMQLVPSNSVNLGETLVFNVAGLVNGNNAFINPYGVGSYGLGDFSISTSNQAGGGPVVKWAVRITGHLEPALSNAMNLGSFLLPVKTNYANTFQAQGGGTNRLGETLFDNSVTITTNLTVLGTTNQVIFGATNIAPASAAAPTKWISVRVTGESAVYRLPLYE